MKYIRIYTESKSMNSYYYEEQTVPLRKMAKGFLTRR